MANLTPQAIYAAVERREAAHRDERRWLGASIIGHICDRYITFKFRAAFVEAFEGRVLRLFKLGQDAEGRFLADLQAAGVKVLAAQVAIDDPKGMGHAGATLDGVVSVEGFEQPLVLEMKTRSAKSFADVASKGVKASKPQHWCQCQYGMGLAELPNALYIAENKDNSELSLEFIPFDKAAFEGLQSRAVATIKNDGAAPRISERADDYRCKFCGMFPICHGGAFAAVRCTTCVHSTPTEGGGWSCDLAEADVPPNIIMRGCPEHIFLPWLIAAKIVDANENAVTYETPAGVRFCNCALRAFPTINDGEAPLIMTSQDLASYGAVGKVTREAFDARLRDAAVARKIEAKEGQ